VNEHSLQTWAQCLAEFLRDSASAQAVRLNPSKHTLSVATIGAIDLTDLEYRLTETLTAIEAQSADSSIVKEPAVVSNLAPFSVREEKGQITVEKPSCPTAPVLWDWREIPWPESPEEAEKHGAREWKRIAFLAAICAVFGLSAYSMELFGIAHWIIIAAYIISIIAGASNSMLDVIEKIPKGQLDIDFLMLAVALGSVCIGAWAEGALLLFLFSTSEAMETFAMYRTRLGIDALFKKTPKQAICIAADGSDIVVKVSQIAPGDRLRIRPGDVVPVDARVTVGESATDESSLTGESVPVDKSVGSLLHSGTINLWGVLEVIALHRASESSLQKMIRLIRDAQHLKAPSQRFTDRFGSRYTQIILGVTALMFFVWWLAFDLPAFSQTLGPSAFYRAMTLLVVASPCALVLSIPSAILASIAWGAQRGILFRGGAAIEKLAEVNCVALDKTGTLTRGELAIESIESFPLSQERQVATLAFNLEKNISHPIAIAIATYGRKNNLEELLTESVRSLTGLGVEGIVNGQKCILGKREILESGPLREWASKLPLASPDHSEVWIVSKELVGRILLRDQIRKAAAPVLAELTKKGIRSVMLTGDHKQTAEAIGRTLGVAEVRYELKPEDKVDAIRELEAQGLTVAMIGDGINDAPSLAAAQVSVAMGSRGADVALEQSQIILMNDRIENFLAAYELSQRARSIIRQNLFLSLGTIGIMVSCAFLGIVPLTIGVMAHEGSTVLVCLNSLRLLLRR
jgi:Zn2+/Cd2+-exporting ATPase